ncbi:MAG: non-heme iron oxygenase ferredoxin subunit [Congregibacter sp.]
MAYQSLEKLINLYDGYCQVRRVGSREILLRQEDGELFVIDRRCPHQGQVLDEADFSDGVLRCPRHQVCFDIRNGSPKPAICSSLATYPLIYDGNTLGIEIEGIETDGD